MQRSKRKLHPPAEQLLRFRLEIVIRWIPQHFDAMADCEGSVIKFDLHIDNVRDSSVRDLAHVFGVPNSTPDGDSVSHPCHIHSSSFYGISVPRLYKAQHGEEFDCLSFNVFDLADGLRTVSTGPLSLS